MANDINISNPAGLAGAAQRAVGAPAQGSERPASSTSTTSGADRVSVTHEATRLRAIEEQLMAVPEVNAARVAEIRQAIADGSFEVNPQRIAEKLLSFEDGANNKSPR